MLVSETENSLMMILHRETEKDHEWDKFRIPEMFCQTELSHCLNITAALPKRGQ